MAKKIARIRDKIVIKGDVLDADGYAIRTRDTSTLAGTVSPTPTSATAGTPTTSLAVIDTVTYNNGNQTVTATGSTPTGLGFVLTAFGKTFAGAPAAGTNPDMTGGVMVSVIGPTWVVTNVDSPAGNDVFVIAFHYFDFSMFPAIGIGIVYDVKDYVGGVAVASARMAKSAKKSAKGAKKKPVKKKAK